MPILPSQRVKTDLLPSDDLLKQLKKSKQEGDGVTEEDFKRLLESHQQRMRVQSTPLKQKKTLEEENLSSDMDEFLLD